MNRKRLGATLTLIFGLSVLCTVAGGAATTVVGPRAVARAVALDTGLYKARVLHSFSGVGIEGDSPVGGLLLDAAGNLYGATENGGNAPPPLNSCGVLFKLSPPPVGQYTWTETVLHVFVDPQGCNPLGDLIMGANGALYGATSAGGGARMCRGSNGCGLVYQLSPPASGTGAWSYSVVHVFSGADGDTPSGGVVADAGGALYGVTSYGGNYRCLPVQYPVGCGVVYRLSPPAAGQTVWTESVLHAFSSAPDGASPQGGILVTRGAIYGTTSSGGSIATIDGLGGGTVFRLVPPPVSGNAWSETLLHSFSGLDGLGPNGNLIMDARGDVYGTTVYGGVPANRSIGTVFELTPPPAGQSAWTERVLHSFIYSSTIYGTPADGVNPLGLCVEGGNIYGTTSGGGTQGVGTYYVMRPPTLGQPVWTETVLHSFDGTDAEGPAGRLTPDGRGTLYGLGNSGGALNNNGTAFKLTHW